jgi:ribulose-phosphate 3-epimerase
MHKLPPAGTVEVAPSILSADFARLGEHIAQVAPMVRLLHLDIMDGHFVPNLTIGPPVVKKLRPHFELFFDTHLMITDPLKYAPEFVRAGSDGITFHLETEDDPRATVRALRKLGIAVGVSIKPGTPVAALAPVIADVDMVLLMTVEPGFGGQAFLPESPARCAQLRQMLRPDQRLEVDGGIDPATTPIIVKAGADTLVAGNAVFGAPDPAAAVRAILHAAR